MEPAGYVVPGRSRRRKLRSASDSQTPLVNCGVQVKRWLRQPDPAAVLLPAAPSSTLTSGLPWLTRTGNACSSPSRTLIQGCCRCRALRAKKGLGSCHCVDCRNGDTNFAGTSCADRDPCAAYSMRKKIFNGK